MRGIGQLDVPRYVVDLEVKGIHIAPQQSAQPFMSLRLCHSVIAAIYKVRNKLGEDHPL